MSDNSFKKDSRLLTKSDFSYLKKGSQVASTKFFRSYFKESKLSYQNHSRIGLVVSKKVGNAVQRNLVKRVIRESFRTHSLRDQPLDFLVLTSPYLRSLLKDSKKREEAKVVIKKQAHELFKKIEKSNRSPS